MRLFSSFSPSFDLKRLKSVQSPISTAPKNSLTIFEIFLHSFQPVLKNLNNLPIKQLL